MTVSIDNVEAELGRLEADWRKYAVIIRVRSVKKPHLHANNEIDPGAMTGQPELLRLVRAAGAACAEYLNVTYGDDFDEGHTGRVAERAFLEEMKMISRIQQEMPKRIADLKANKQQLTDVELALLDKLEYLQKVGDSITSALAQQLDMALVRLSGQQLG